MIWTLIITNDKIVNNVKFVGVIGDMLGWLAICWGDWQYVGVIDWQYVGGDWQYVGVIGPGDV